MCLDQLVSCAKQLIVSAWFCVRCLHVPYLHCLCVFLTLHLALLSPSTLQLKGIKIREIVGLTLATVLCARCEEGATRGVRHEQKSRTLWQKSIGNHWKSVGNHGNLARNQKSGPSRNQEISEKSQEILEK